MTELRVIVDSVPGIGDEPAVFVGLEDQHGEPVDVGAWISRRDGRYEARVDVLNLVFGQAFTTPTDVRNAILALSQKFRDLETHVSARLSNEELDEAHRLLEEGLSRVSRATEIVATGVEEQSG